MRSNYCIVMYILHPLASLSHCKNVMFSLRYYVVANYELIDPLEIFSVSQLIADIVTEQAWKYLH